MALDPGQFWKNWFAQREVSRLFQGNNFGTPPPTGGAVMGGAAPQGGALVPITKEGVRVGAGTVEGAAPRLVRAATVNGPAMVTKGVTPGMELVPAGVRTAAGVGEAAAPLTSTAARSGLVNTLRGAIGLAPAEAAGFRAGAAGVLGKMALPAGIAMGGVQAGGMLDESNWLGGSESAANDYTSKALKLGGVGAGAGLLFGGPAGAAIGGGVGAGSVSAGRGWSAPGS
jgi:hypothetical protein